MSYSGFDVCVLQMTKRMKKDVNWVGKGQAMSTKA